MRYCCRFPTKSDFPCLLKLIFYCKAPLFIVAKSFFSSRAELFLSWITEIKDLLSSNSLAFENNPSDKSLMYIKNNDRQSIEPWERLAYLIKLNVFYLSESYIDDLVNY